MDFPTWDGTPECLRVAWTATVFTRHGTRKKMVRAIQGAAWNLLDEKGGEEKRTPGKEERP
jgi:hypothetical protein